MNIFKFFLLWSIGIVPHPKALTLLEQGRQSCGGIGWMESTHLWVSTGGFSGGRVLQPALSLPFPSLFKAQAWFALGVEELRPVPD